MMDCNRGRQMIHAELDGELREDHRELLAGHLAECPSCSQFRAGLMALTTDLAALPLPAQPEGFRDVVMSQVEGLARKRRGRLWRLRPALPWVGVGLSSTLCYAALAIAIIFGLPQVASGVGGRLPALLSAGHGLWQSGGAIWADLSALAVSNAPLAICGLAAYLAVLAGAGWKFRQRLLPAVARVRDA